MKLTLIKKAYGGTVWELTSELNRNRVQRGNAGGKSKRK